MTDEIRTRALEHRDRWLPGVPILESLPDGWHVVKGAQTQPNGTCWVAKGSRFDGTYQHALMWL